MAGDWIKFEIATLDKPEVIAMADLLNTSTYDVVGRLLRVWGWFDQQTRNGNAVSVTGNALKRYIDVLAGSQGFASCMQKVGWLSDDGMPNFDRHNGKSAKERALTNDRVKRSRNADTVTKALPEKRREEKRKTDCASRLSKDWTLPEDWKTWALREKPAWTDAWVRSVSDRFKDYWLAAPKGSKLDWEATWRNWVRNSHDPRADQIPQPDKFAGAI